MNADDVVAVRRVMKRHNDDQRARAHERTARSVATRWRGGAPTEKSRAVLQAAYQERESSYAAEAGVSSFKYRRLRGLIRAADEDPDRFGPLLARFIAGEPLGSLSRELTHLRRYGEPTAEALAGLVERLEALAEEVYRVRYTPMPEPALLERLSGCMSQLRKTQYQLAKECE